MMRLGSFAWIALTFAGCAPEHAPDAPAAAGGAAPKPARDRLAATLQADVDRVHADGVIGVLAQVRNGDATVAARAGETGRGSGVRVAFDSRFRIGSNTKTFVAVVMLQLVGEGKLALEDTVDRWLPGVVSGNGNDGATITIRQLLQHATGLADYADDLYPPNVTVDDFKRLQFQHWEPAQLVAMAMVHPPKFAPGAQWGYCNTNYIIAGMIIHKVTGNDWADEVDARIVEPLHLDATFDPGDWPDLPQPHVQAYLQFPGTEPLVDVTLLNHTQAGAAGALVTTTDDLTRFWRALQSGELLAPAEMTAMRTTVPQPEPGVGYGLGIESFPTSCGSRYWSHGGDTLGFSVRNAVSEDGQRAVVLSINTQLTTPAAGQRLESDHRKLLDDAMCAERL